MVNEGTRKPITYYVLLDFTRQELPFKKFWKKLALLVLTREVEKFLIGLR